MNEQFDTSSFVEGACGTSAGRIFWTDLSPGVRGIVRAALKEARTILEADRRHPLPIGRVPGFSDLHPDTLARIIAYVDEDTDDGWLLSDLSDVGQNLDWFRYDLSKVVTIALNDEGKVIFKDKDQ